MYFGGFFRNINVVVDFGIRWMFDTCKATSTQHGRQMSFVAISCARRKDKHSFNHFNFITFNVYRLLMLHRLNDSQYQRNAASKFTFSSTLSINDAKC